MTTKAEIDEFLSHKKLAIAGVSRNGRGFGNGALKEMVGARLRA